MLTPADVQVSDGDGWRTGEDSRAAAGGDGRSSPAGTPA